MRVLITGGSGFIGTNLLQNFVDKDLQVLNLDKCEPRNINHLNYWKKVDILNYDEVEKVFKSFNPHYIIHLAARTDLDGKNLDDYNSNIIGVENILKATKLLTNLKKILFTSSMLVCSPGYIPSNNLDYHPSTIYGESKVLSEKIVYNNPPKCKWAIIRPTSIWGPWFGAPYKNFFNLILKGRYFHVGKKGCTKTYGYVKNAIYQIERILLTDDLVEDNSRLYYIGDYVPTNIESWANEIALELNLKIYKLPYFLLWILAITGDIVMFFGLRFPMTTFRLKNMTTDNIIDLSTTKKIVPNLPYSRTDGIIQTLNWMKNQNS